MSNFPGKTFFSIFLIFLNFFCFGFGFLGLGQPGWEQRGTNLAHLAAGSPRPLFSRQRRSAGVAGTPAQVLPQALPRIELETNVVPQLCFGALLPHTALSNNGAAKRKCSRMRNAEKKSERLALHGTGISYHTIYYTILYYTILYYTQGFILLPLACPLLFRYRHFPIHPVSQ
ncbi:hypothetical protein FIM1_4079 [Kluyveromyces marxianus]|uniref:Uncharacterized protein n=1 Tax=Kluyveromyces marxianus TaxID=4911 RepID=A0ABX6F1V3_KLUMA|nr:hypothetical protein FIM1_4079 [Kluyveromyces marxianus]